MNSIFTWYTITINSTENVIEVSSSFQFRIHVTDSLRGRLLDCMTECNSKLNTGLYLTRFALTLRTNYFAFSRRLSDYSIYVLQTASVKEGVEASDRAKLGALNCTPNKLLSACWG